MFGFLKSKASGSEASPHVKFLSDQVANLEKRLRGRVPIEEHAVDHLCDFIAEVARVHPMGPHSQAAADVEAIAQAVRALAGRRGDSGALEAVRQVFGRYADYRDKEVTFEALFELAEWTLGGAIRMRDGGYPDGAQRWRTLAIWFEDLTLCPERALPGIAPQRGMPERWFNVLLGNAKAEKRRYVDEGVLEAAVVELPPPFPTYDGLLSEQFVRQLMETCQLLGTIPWIRDYSEDSYREAWDSGRRMASIQETENR